MYFAVKVTSGQEKIVATMLQNKATKSDLPIYAVLVLSGMKGYIIVEAENEVAKEILNFNKQITTVVAQIGAVSGKYRLRMRLHAQISFLVSII